MPLSHKTLGVEYNTQGLKKGMLIKDPKEMANLYRGANGQGCSPQRGAKLGSSTQPEIITRPISENAATNQIQPKNHIKLPTRLSITSLALRFRTNRNYIA